MKGLATLLIFFSFSIMVGFSQPNGGFEDWQTEFDYETPTSWQTFNILSLYNPPMAITSFKATGINVHSGNYALKLRSEVVTQTNIQNTFGDTAGGIFMGNFTYSPFSVEYGIPYNARPEKLTFWAKYSPLGDDVGGAGVFLSKSVNGQRDTIGLGIVFISECDNYTFFEVPITYQTNDTPDSMTIAFATSYIRATARLHSTMYIDDVLLTGGDVGISENSTRQEQVVVFPNPAHESIIVQTNNFKDAQNIVILTADGKKISSHLLDSQKTQIETKHFVSGMYLYQLTDHNNKVLKTGKFSVINTN